MLLSACGAGRCALRHAQVLLSRGEADVDRKALLG